MRELDPRIHVEHVASWMAAPRAAMTILKEQIKGQRGKIQGMEGNSN
jgi:hypothetical protein